MCTPPDGKYWKEAPDWLFQPRTWYWDKNSCNYRLLSTLMDDDAQLSIYYNDPNYSEIFADGGGSNGNGFDIGIDGNGNAGSVKSDTTKSNTTGIFDNIEKYLIPAKLEQNNLVQKALLIAALVTVAFILYKIFKK